MAPPPLGSAAPDPIPTPGKRRERSVSPPEFSDDAVAVRFTNKHAHSIRYTEQLGKWHLWDGQRWVEDETGHVLDMSRLVCREVSATCPWPGLARSLASKARATNVERLARADRRHAVTVNQWDQNPWLLNTPAGTVDLRSSQLRPHHREDHITKITAVAPGGRCLLWMKFLDRVTDGNSDLQAYLQRVSGYILTGVTREHALFFLYGTGANGKGVFIETLASVLGDYARVAALDTFMASVSERHPTDLAGLMGARLVTTGETEEGRRWAESKLKSITGGDTISARFMHEDFFDFKPQFKLVIAGNHKPGIRNVDEAIRRRLHLIGFNVTIPEEERDRDLTEKLRCEWGGILMWMIDGCTLWQEQGLCPPAVVRSATQDYLSAEDALGRWVDERVVHGDHFTTASALYDDWRQWCEATGEYVGTLKQFSQKLEQRPGVTKERTMWARGFRGIALNTDIDSAHR